MSEDHLEAIMRRARRVTVPHRVNELASGDNLPSPQSKETQHQALLRRARTQPAVIRAHPDGPKEPDRDFTAHRPHPPQGTAPGVPSPEILQVLKVAYRQHQRSIWPARDSHLAAGNSGQRAPRQAPIANATLLVRPGWRPNSRPVGASKSVMRSDRPIDRKS